MNKLFTNLPIIIVLIIIHNEYIHIKKISVLCLVLNERKKDLIIVRSSN